MNTYLPFFSSGRRFSGVVAMLVLTMLLAAPLALAQDDNEVWDPFARGDEPAGVVTGQVGKRAEYIYPVEFTHIDGRAVTRRDIMWLKPGRYELTVRGFVDYPPGLRSATRRARGDGMNRITVVVEAGKQYSVGLKRQPRDSAAPYVTVLYKVDDYPAGARDDDAEEDGPGS